jgi:ribosomal-protein-alanine N-acetyltransferase
LELFVRNREFFKPTMPLKEDSFFTIETQLEALRRIDAEQERGERCQFGIFLRKNGRLAGNVVLAQIKRMHLMSCKLGYFLDREHTGRGLATEAVGLACRYAFEVLGLHRIEAGVMPSNIASLRVLEKAGFVREGIARKNLRINGRWEDHVMFSLLDDEYFADDKPFS